MNRLRTLNTTLTIQLWFNLIVICGGTVFIGAAILLPNLLAAREQARQAALTAGMDATVSFGPAEILTLLLVFLPIVALLTAFATLPLIIRRGLRDGKNMTVLLWINALINLLNFPVGSALAAVQIIQFSHPDTQELIRTGQASHA